MTDLPPKRSSSLQQELARQIMALIRAGEWGEGERLPEQTLSRRLEVSRTPVRFALKILEQNGVLRQEPGRGFVLVQAVGDIGPAEADLPTPQSEDLYQRMVADRSTGRLGSDVSEAELAERYATAKGIVRRVLLRLAAEGLATRQRGHGWKFAETLETEAAVDESYAFRITIECGALRQPGFRVEPEALHALRQAQRALLKAAPDTISREVWFQANSAFHETLVAWSNNRFFLQAMRQQNSLRRMQEYAGFSRLSPLWIRRSCEGKLRILDALEEGDVQFAEALLRRQLELASRDLLTDPDA
ncbi:GntR family transcriptional regulator [Novispirillum itersonii]|uniref:DNA-binding GntR family transcriptional regulator n=1 Tax=Novispirillum itersonii TaxID=189 RepID=A0A7X0DKV3_NOVIT|nr:GntR family transcriptional regulator [Novispirillum itersonii]MBB6209310.1 DNA-binding GntR family transcriptional regulator [Novispirillum itersonii]